MRCPTCGDTIATGCLCDVASSNCVSWSGAGSLASPYIPAFIFDPSANQLASCASGFKVTLPTSLTNPPSCLAFSTVGISIPNNTLTAVDLNSEKYDTDTMHSNTVNPSRITFTTAGVYVITWVCAFDKSIVGDRSASIRKNGTTILAKDIKPTGGLTNNDLTFGFNLQVQGNFSAADYIEGMVQQTSGGALILFSESYSPFLSADKVA